MTPTTRLSVLRVEGLPQDHSSLGCYISLNNLLVDIVTPLSRPSHCDLTPQCRDATLRLVIRYMGKEDHVVGVVAVPLSLLPEEKQTWLPLRRGNERELVTSLQAEVKFPRIAVVLEELEPETKKKPKLNLMIPSSSPQASRANPFLSALHTQKSLKQFAVIQDLTKQLTSLESILEKQKSQELVWRDLMTSVKQASAESLSLAVEREKELRQLLQYYERQRVEHIGENLGLKHELTLQESELEVLREEVRLLRAENFVLKSEVQDRQSIEESSVLRRQLSDLKKRLSAFENVLRQSPQRAAPSPSTPATPVQTESFIDLAVNELFHGQSPLAKIAHGVYSFNGEKIPISFRGGMLVVKAKSGYLLLSEYLRMREIEIATKEEEYGMEFKDQQPVPSPICDGTKSDLVSEDDSTFRTDLFDLLKEIDPSSPMHRLKRDKRKLQQES